MKKLSLLIAIVFLQLSLFSQCQHFEWLNPNPHSNGTFAAQFITPTTIVAVGERGILTRSEDAGATWSVFPQLTIYDMEGLHFIDSLTGWACGNINSSGVIVKTTDGGLNWQVVEESSATGISSTRSIYFVNDTLGFCGTFNKMLKSTDGGETWTSMAMGNSYAINSIDFINDSTGVAVAGPRIYRTNNRGNSWTQVLVDSNVLFTDIQMVNDTLGFAITSSSTTRAYKTINGGLTWTAHPIVVSWVIDAFHMRPDGVGFISAGSNAIYYRSTDFGTTWSVVQTPNYGNDSNVIVTNDEGAVVCFGDNGIVWQSTSNGDPNTFVDRQQDEQYSFRTMDFTDINTGHFFGRDYIVKTTDGGQTFTSTPITTARTANCVHFPTANFGYCVGQDGLRWRTTNGGQTWQNVSITSTQDMYEVYFLDEQRGFICGEGGTVIKTVDGGTTWTSIGIGTSLFLRDVLFLNDNVGFVCGASGTLKKTIDGGATWTTINTGTTTAYFFCVYFINDMIGFCSGEDGRLLRTVDGGNTWTISTAGYGDDIMEVQFVNELEGYFITEGFNGVLYRTWNGGLNWYFHSIVNNYGINEFDLFDENHIYGIGGFYSGLWRFSPSVNQPTIGPEFNVCANDVIPGGAPEGWNTRWMASSVSGPVISQEDALDVSLLSGSTTVWVSYYQGDCESIRKPLQINISGSSTPPVISASTLLACDGEMITLEASGEGEILWSNEMTGNTIEVGTAGTYTATAFVNGCSSPPSNEIVLTFTPAPELPMYEVLEYDPCFPTNVSIIGISNDHLRWADAQGSIMLEDQSFYITDLLIESSSVFVQAYNDDGCTSPWVEIPLEMSTTPPTPEVSIAESPICTGATTQVSVTEGFDVMWSFGLGEATEELGAGTYFVYLQNGSCVSPTAEFTIEETVVNAPVIYASQTEFCEGSEVTLYTDQVVLWSNGVMADSQVVTEETHITARAVNGICISEASNLLIVTAVPNPADPTFELSFYDPCQSAAVGVFSSAGVNTNWYDADLNFITDNTGEFNTDVLSTNTVFYIEAYNATGCLSNLVPVNIPFNETPPAPFLVASADVICEGDESILSVDSLYQIAWSTGSNNASIAVSEAGVYSVVYIENGCSSEPTVFELTVNPAPVTPVITLSADGDHVEVQDIYLNYYWYRDGIMMAGVDPVVTAGSLSAEFQVEVTNEFGCSAMSEVFVFIPDNVDLVSNVVSLFPNPASDKLLLTSISFARITKVYSEMGHVVWQGSARQLDVSGWANATYFVEFTTDEGIQVEKIVVSH